MALNKYLHKSSNPIKGENVITPIFLKDYSNDKFYVELSKGTGLSGGTVYGITVYDLSVCDIDSDLSTMVTRIDHAEAYILDLMEDRNL